MPFTYMYEDEIDPELMCMICNDPFQVPFNCLKCGQTFCQKCIDTWYEQQKSCPSCRQHGNLFVPVLTRIVLNQLNRLLVQCSLCQQSNIKRLDYVDHLTNVCPKQIVLCPNRCRWKGRRENLEKHFIHCRDKWCICY